MKTLFAPLMLACAQAFATPSPPLAVEKMVAQSEFYMHCDICQVANDRTAYPPGAFAQFYIAGQGLIRVPIDQYRVIQNAGKDVGISGLYVMSERVQAACRDDWDGGVCHAARFLWRQEWPSGQCVTPTGAIYNARQQ